MRLIEVDDVKYHVLSQVEENQREFISKLKKWYKDRSGEIRLLHSKSGGPYLICRRIDDAEYEEIGGADVINV